MIEFVYFSPSLRNSIPMFEIPTFYKWIIIKNGIGTWF